MTNLARVIGPPGCGKTTWLSKQVRLAHEAGKDVMICSLTRTTAAEVAGHNLPIPSENIGTLHAHAYRALRGEIMGIADTPDMLAEWNNLHAEYALSGATADLLEESHGAAMDGKAPGDNVKADYDCNRAKMLDRSGWLVSTRGFSRVWEEWKKENGYLDFTDLLEVGYQNIAAAPGNPDIVFADEAQDFSALEMALLQKWGQAAGQLVIVGDPYQALYDWRGADARIFFEGEAEYERVLPQSYRVPQAVHSAAMNWIQQMPGYRPIEYRPTEEKGVVEKCHTATWNSPREIGDLLTCCIDGGQSVMLLASCSYMLTAVIAMMREQGIPFHNTYRRRNGAWNPLSVKRSATSSAHRLAAYLRISSEGSWSRADLQMWLPMMQAGVFPIQKKQVDAEVGLLPDGELSYEDLEPLLGDSVLAAGMAGDLDWYLANLQKARVSSASYPAAIAARSGRSGLLDEPRVTVGTIHSVKGGEADVVILAPDLSHRGVEAWNIDRAPICRQFYVGITRAREALYILKPVNPSMAVELI